MTDRALRKRQEQLRRDILSSLYAQGFKTRSGKLVTPDTDNKDTRRQLHREAVRHRIEQARPGLKRHEGRLLLYIAAGSEIVPEQIMPRLVEVLPDSEDELLFRYARLHWSIPVSAGYGRRLRFVARCMGTGATRGDRRWWRRQEIWSKSWTRLSVSVW